MAEAESIAGKAQRKSAEVWYPFLNAQPRRYPSGRRSAGRPPEGDRDFGRMSEIGDQLRWAAN